MAGGIPCTDEGRGEPVVLVHGVGMNRAVWAPQVEAFAATHRVIAYDLLGHGDSPLPPEEPVLADYAGQLERLLDGLDIGCANLVGHSMGALVALAFATARPERVLRLAALNAVFDRSPRQRAAVRARADELDAGGIAAVLDGTLARWFGAPVEDRLADRARQVRAWLEAVDPVGYARTYRLFATADAAFVGRLDRLTMPSLFLTGGEDANSSPTMSRRMAEEAPSGTARVVPGERHMMSFTSPERVNPILRAFLATPPSPAAGRGRAP